MKIIHMRVYRDVRALTITQNGLYAPPGNVCNDFCPNHVIVLNTRHLNLNTNSHNNQMSVLYIFAAHGVGREWWCVHKS